MSFAIKMNRGYKPQQNKCNSLHNQNGFKIPWNGEENKNTSYIKVFNANCLNYKKL